MSMKVNTARPAFLAFPISGPYWFACPAAKEPNIIEKVAMKIFSPSETPPAF
jgi:hypothetical protein